MIKPAVQKTVHPRRSVPPAGQERPFALNRRGFSQAELLITLVLLSVGFLAAVAAFKGMSKGILVTKTKSLATNLAQEKIEFLKDKSYYRLRVSSNIVTVSEPDPDVDSDPGNYPAETITVGGIPFTRYAVVGKVRKQAGSDQLELANWNDTDTGLKLIKVTVVWREGPEWKQLKLENLRENPNRGAATVTFQGVVRSTVGASLANAVVEVAENPSWRDETDSSGNYSFDLSPGTWTVRASSTPYFTISKTDQVVSTSSSPATVNFTGSDALPKKSSGTVTGSVWLVDHLVISQVVGSTTSLGFDQEWVEIYNPTTWTWTASDVGLKFQRVTGVDASPVNITIDYATPDIGPREFYLFANTGTVYAAGVVLNADAVWDLDPGTNDTAFAPRFSVADPNIITTFNDNNNWGAGSLQLYRVSDGAVLDTVGWEGNGSNAEPPLHEANAIDQNQGLNDIEQFYRYSSTGGYNPAYGPSYDSGDNDRDFDILNPLGWVPKNSASASVSPAAGSPADGAYVFATDGLSSTVQASTASLNPPYAKYTLPSIATGTWTVAASSGTSYYEFSVTVGGNGTSQTQDIFLTSSTELGYVSGQVTKVGGGVLSGITVNPGGVTTDAGGYYRLATSAGAATITANPNSVNSSYVEDSATVTVVMGQIVSGVNFTLSGGGKIRGKVTSDGTNALPGIPVSITNTATSLEVANELSEADGYFEASVATGTYYVAPIGEFGEVVTPSSATVTVTSGGTVTTTTFTIGPALGTITGNVTANGEAITGGVLIIASTGTVSDPPPDVDTALRSGGLVYYMASSSGDGTYSLDVHAGTYNVYGWYTTFNGQTPSTTRRSRTGVVVTAGNTTTGQNLSW